MSARRHPAEVVADRLGDFVTKYPDKFDAGERDEISHIMHALYEIAEGKR